MALVDEDVLHSAFFVDDCSGWMEAVGVRIDEWIWPIFAAVPLVTIFFYKEPPRETEGVTLKEKLREIGVVLSDVKFTVFLILLGLFFWLPSFFVRSFDLSLLDASVFYGAILLIGGLGTVTGTLLGAAFLGMIPAGLERAPASHVLTGVLAGIVLFFLLEKLVLWRHCHEIDCESHGQAAPLILIGDAFHNFVDGVVIAAAFLTSVPLGVATAVAVIAHEIPQEIGDFAILLESGYSRTKALLFNTLSSITTLPGAVLAYLWLAEAQSIVPYVLALSAASFIYIATADLVPNLHRKFRVSDSAIQVALLLAGIITIALLNIARG